MEWLSSSFGSRASLKTVEKTEVGGIDRIVVVVLSKTLAMNYHKLMLLTYATF